MPEAPSPAQIQADVQRALDEDIGTGDLTASLVPAGRRVTATVICRESAIFCGRPWVDEVLRRLAPNARAHWQVQDGGRCAPGFTEVDGVLAGWFHRHGVQAALVRPDHYVYGVSSTPAELASQFADLSAMRAGGAAETRLAARVSR